MTHKDDKDLLQANNFFIVTATYYNFSNKSDVIRAGVSQRMIKNAIKEGYRVIVADGGSSAELLKLYESLGAVVLSLQKRGRGIARRLVIKKAYDLGAKIILWTEPEKEDLIRSIPQMLKPLLDDYADIVIPARKSLRSYPYFQAQSELLGNRFWSELTGQDLDIFFGPRAWKREITQYYLAYRGEYGDTWDDLTIPLIDALHDGKRVTGAAIDYLHPAEQSEFENYNNEFNLKRIGQLQNITLAIYKHWLKKGLS